MVAMDEYVRESNRNRSSNPQTRSDQNEIIFEPDETRPETMVNRKVMKQEAEQLLGTLGERDAMILRLYFGFNGEITRSFEEIGRLLNLSRDS
ncbi:hypothetical protein Sjap_026143 [Stephania japonica]|uniref:RNA polymerase sigma-70 region 4 domain-containing protein n=1 Tax=Stephania japonica TaxID=461633 RepID=A0AAP0E6G6_9MAGN